MPGKDGTGPFGVGAMSGRGLGLCKLTNRFTPFNRVGYGCGNGFRRNASFEFVTPRTERDFLIEQKKLLENRLEIINNQLESL